MSDTIVRLNSTPLRDRGYAASVVAALSAGVALLVIGVVVLDWTSSGGDFPAEGSVEVGFARDMSVHHAQAVEMAELIRERTQDPALRQLAVDISLTQQAQIGQMRGWLDVWERPPSATGPRMAWMHEPAEGTMPGMATRADLNRLRRLRGRRADALFLTLMLEHHRAGVVMAEAVLDRTDEPVVQRLARAVATAQANEQEVMRRMLDELGASRPRPESEPGRSHVGGEH